jgi:LmbE family N-acetylglucosaminyl deacetylase
MRRPKETTCPRRTCWGRPLLCRRCFCSPHPRVQAKRDVVLRLIAHGHGDPASLSLDSGSAHHRLVHAISEPPRRPVLASPWHRLTAMTTAVLSPHFDDAVLSCWHVLGGSGPVVVVNVFAGAPPEGTPAGWWDRLTGAVDASERLRERAREDRAALALAGRAPLNLGLVEAQYRRQSLSPAMLAPRIAPAISGCDAVYAPAALGTHPDHALVRDAALSLRAEGAEVRLYADLPHAVRRGWPTWVAPDGLAVADDQWSRALARAGISEGRLHPHVHVLERLEHRRKLAAVRTYATQLTELERRFGALTRILCYEVVWELDPA